MPCCAAVNCTNRTENGFKLYLFPRNPERRKLWAAKVKREIWQPTNSSRLCEVKRDCRHFKIIHFDDNQFEKNRQDGWKKLRQDAVPTLFSHASAPRVRKPPLKRGPKVTPTKDNAKRVRTEHNYFSTTASSTLLAVDLHTDLSPTECSSSMNNQDGPSSNDTFCLFNDYNIAGNVEVVTASRSPCKHLPQKEQVMSLSKQNKHMKNQIRSLKRKLELSRKSSSKMIQKLQKIFGSDQIQCLQSNGLSNRGRNWRPETIQRSLQLRFSCGPTGYQVLREQGYPLPSSRTLPKSLEGIHFNSGILKEVFEVLCIKVKNMNENEKYCSLTLDEMSIAQSVEFDVRSGRVMGEVTLPGHTGKATHALVFMLAGISTRWKQTVAYYFTGNSVYGEVLKPIIINIVKAAAEIGLKFVSVTSDMGACNRAMWNSFGVRCGRLFDTINQVMQPCFDGDHLYFLADGPHVIKNLKAALVNGQNITLPDWLVQEMNLSSNIVTADHLRSLLEFQENMQLKISPGLTAKTLA